MSGNILATRNTLNAPFWDAAACGRLCLPHCEASGRAFWPPSTISPYEEAAAVSWRDVAPTGVLKARVTYRRSFVPAFEPHIPYGVGLVELDCGPRLLAHIVHPDQPDAPRQGERVRLQFEALVEADVPILTVRRQPQPGAAR